MAQGVKHEPNDVTRQTVRNLSADGVPAKKIAAYMGIAKSTLEKYYQDEFNSASVEKIRMVSNALYQSAINGSVPAQIFFLKCQAYWREVKLDDDEKQPDGDINKIQIEVIGNAKQVNG